MTDPLTHVRNDLERVVEEARKAASYLAVSRAVYRVPDFARRWTQSNAQWAMDYCRKGTHMAFAVTLAATLDDRSSGDIVTIPKVMRKVSDPAIRLLAAQDRCVRLEVVDQAAQRAIARFNRLKALPIYESLRQLRHNVIAHHNRIIEHHGATQGALNRLMIGTLSVVNRMSITLNGEPPDICDDIAHVKRTATHYWEYGIDGHPEYREETSH